jgi:hypothetical protein
VVEVSKPSDYWRDWTLNTGKYTWRLATSNDTFRIDDLRKRTELLTGEKQRDPNLFAMPVLLALVAQDKDGNVVDCLYVEVNAELVKMSCDPDSFKEVAKLEPDLITYLRSIGVKSVMATTLHRHKEKMTGGLMSLGFSCMDRIFSYWRRIL